MSASRPRDSGDSSDPMAEEGISRPGSSAVASRIAIAPSLCRGSSPIHSCARAIECRTLPPFSRRDASTGTTEGSCDSAIRCELAPRIGAVECLPQRCFIRRDRPVVGGRFRQEFLKRPGILPLRYVILPGERVICPRRFPGGISLLASLISFSRPWSPIVSRLAGRSDCADTRKPRDLLPVSLAPQLCP